jgi:hypothetical protein
MVSRSIAENGVDETVGFVVRTVDREPITDEQDNENRQERDKEEGAEGFHGDGGTYPSPEAESALVVSPLQEWKATRPTTKRTRRIRSWVRRVFMSKGGEDRVTDRWLRCDPSHAHKGPKPVERELRASKRSETQRQAGV